MSAGRQSRPHNVHRAVLELGERLLAEQDLPSLLKLTTDVVASVIQTDLVAILELGPDHRTMQGLAAKGIDSAASMQRITNQPDPFSLEALRTGAVIVVADLLHDRRFAAPAASEKTMLSGITATIHHGSHLFCVLTVRS